MSNPIIKVENLGKKYHIGGHIESYQTLRDTIMSAPKALIRRFRGGHAYQDETIWALKDVSFEVKRGEVVGIIGRNGAGKTTLLKILSRITEPTEGYVDIYGMVGSLLEVGTGFHPELTGRENIYLNGAILGMKKTEIQKKFDEIVAFAELEKFIDTPVKRYSSGMYVRLAFAVAAHLEPEILLVDEVLAVGDIAFQKKCLGKMGDVAKEGRTVLFVSHNMGAISALCSRVILLENGKKTMDDITEKTIERYLALMSETTRIPLSARSDREGTGRMRFIDAWLEDDKGNRVDIVRSGQDVSIVAVYQSADKEPLKNPHIGFALRESSGHRITDLWNEGAGYTWMEIPANGKIKCKLPRLPLNAGNYFFSVCCIMNGVTVDWVIDAGKFNVEAGDFFGTGKLPKKVHGSYLLYQKWTVSDKLVETS